MALNKIEFKPGIIREVTNYSNSGGWFEADKVRWRQGFPEKIGGWLQVAPTGFDGSCRHIHQWSDLESNRYIALGTSTHLYILWSQDYYDITPVKTHLSPLAAAPFTTGPAGSTTMTLNAPGNNAIVNDWVVISGATGFDAYTAADLNQAFKVTAVSGATVTFQMPKPCTAAGATGGGSAVAADFLISPGLDDATVGEGWGVPPWNSWASVGAAPANLTCGWGSPYDPTQLNPADPTTNQLRLWDIDNFGEDLVANIRGGAIYYWHRSGGLSARAVPLNQAVTVGGVTYTPADVPATARQVLVSPNDRHLIAMGCEDYGASKPDLLLVRWSTEEDAYMWTPLRTNSAGSQRLGSGSFIIAGMRTSNVILIWTDLGLWSMSYIGMPYVFGFQEIAEGLSLIGPNAAINIGSAVLWMDRGIFYSWTGQTQELPCALKDYVFSDFNYLQGYKVYCGHNHAFSEVFWFYPSAASMEVDRYVIYNYAEQLWSMGQLQRTAWLDMGRDSYPVAADRDNHQLYFHEYGDDANGQPMAAWIDSADIDAGGGDRYLFVSRFIADVLFRGKAGQDQSLGVTIFGRPSPLKPKTALQRIEVTPDSGHEDIRVRERQLSFRFESTAPGVGWRLGTIRADWRADGRR